MSTPARRANNNKKGKKNTPSVKANNTNKPIHTATAAQKASRKEKKKAWANAQRAKRFDPRLVATNLNREVVVASNSVSNIDFSGELSTQAMGDIATGWICAALSKGALARTQPYDLYLAYGFLTRAINAAANSQSFTNYAIPMWMRNLLQGLQPKAVPFMGGTATYSYTDISAPPDMTNVSPIGPGVWNYSLSWQLPNNGAPLVNGYPVCNLWSPPPYDPIEGAAAFARVSQLMIEDNNDCSKLVPITSPTIFLKDASAFCPTMPQMGFGATTQLSGISGNRYQNEVWSEVPIYTPLMAGIVSFSSFTNRFPKHIMTFGGDQVFQSVMMSGVIAPCEVHLKRSPIFKIVDFFQFYEVLANWVQKVQQASVSEFVNAQGDGSQFQCPLTLQEVGLLLRNLMMGAFKNTQPGVQGLGPLTPNNVADNLYCPLFGCVNTAFVSPTDMKLPIMLIENIRALTFRKNYPGRKGSKGDPQYWIPILAKRTEDVLLHSDYTYTITPPGGAPITYDSFKDPSTVYKVVDSKGVTKVLAETPVDFIDGSSSSGYLAINDTQRNAALADLWNNWVNTVSSHSTQLGTYGTELGISILTSICMTRHVKQGTIGTDRLSNRSIARVTDARIGEAGMLSGPYSAVECLMDSSAGTIITEPYEKVLSRWILPVNLVRLETSPQVQSTQLQRYCGYVQEPFSISRVSGEDAGIVLGDLLQKYAASMVKGNFTAQDDISQFLVEAAQLGRGGILSGLLGGVAKGLAGAFGAPSSVNGVIDSIANVIPI